MYDIKLSELTSKGINYYIDLNRRFNIVQEDTEVEDSDADKIALLRRECGI